MNSTPSRVWTTQEKKKQTSKKSIKHWIGKTTSAVLILVMIMSLCFVLYAAVSGETPNIFGYELMVVLSGSMEPTIQTGSVIAVKPTTDPGGYEAGDVITFHTSADPNTFITHRIIEVDGASKTGVQYVTKGDNNDAQDPAPVPAERVIAHYADFTVPWVGYIAEFSKSRFGIVLLFIVPGVILMISQLIHVWRVMSQEDGNEASSAEVKKSTLDS